MIREVSLEQMERILPSNALDQIYYFRMTQKFSTQSILELMASNQYFARRIMRSQDARIRQKLLAAFVRASESHQYFPLFKLMVNDPAFMDWSFGSAPKNTIFSVQEMRSTLEKMLKDNHKQAETSAAFNRRRLHLPALAQSRYSRAQAYLVNHLISQKENMLSSPYQSDVDSMINLCLEWSIHHDRFEIAKTLLTDKDLASRITNSLVGDVLYRASLKGDRDTLHILLSSGSLLERIPSASYRLSLYWITQHGFFGMINYYFANHHISALLPDNSVVEAFISGCRQGQVESVHTFLTNPAILPRLSDGALLRGLENAANHGQLTIVKSMLSRREIADRIPNGPLQKALRRMNIIRRGQVLSFFLTTDHLRPRLSAQNLASLLFYGIESGETGVLESIVSDSKLLNQIASADVDLGIRKAITHGNKELINLVRGIHAP